MNTFIAVLHVLVALVLIGLVLIQDSKGGGALGMGGGGGGGGSNSVFGATGASSLAAKMTRIAAIVFALTSIGLSIMSTQASKSVIDGSAPAAAAPVVPGVPGDFGATPNPNPPPTNTAPDAAAPAGTAPSAPTQTAPSAPTQTAPSVPANPTK